MAAALPWIGPALGIFDALSSEPSKVEYGMAPTQQVNYINPRAKNLSEEAMYMQMLGTLPWMANNGGKIQSLFGAPPSMNLNAMNSMFPSANPAWDGNAIPWQQFMPQWGQQQQQQQNEFPWMQAAPNGMGQQNTPGYIPMADAAQLYPFTNIPMQGGAA